MGKVYLKEVSIDAEYIGKEEARAYLADEAGYEDEYVDEYLMHHLDDDHENVEKFGIRDSYGLWKTGENEKFAKNHLVDVNEFNADYVDEYVSKFMRHDNVVNDEYSIDYDELTASYKRWRSYKSEDIDHAIWELCSDLLDYIDHEGWQAYDDHCCFIPDAEKKSIQKIITEALVLKSSKKQEA